MKFICLITFLLSLLLVVSCGLLFEGCPEETVYNHLEKLKEGDVEGAMDYLVEGFDYFGTNIQMGGDVPEINNFEVKGSKRLSKYFTSEQEQYVRSKGELTNPDDIALVNVIIDGENSIYVVRKKTGGNWEIGGVERDDNIEDYADWIKYKYYGMF